MAKHDISLVVVVKTFTFLKIEKRTSILGQGTYGSREPTVPRTPSLIICRRRYLNGLLIKGGGAG